MKALTVKGFLSIVVLSALVSCATTQSVGIKDPFVIRSDSSANSSTGFDFHEYQLKMLGDTFSGLSFIQGSGTEKYDYNQISFVAKASEIAKKKYDDALLNNAVTQVFGGAGGALIGYPIGNSLATKSWTSADSYLLAGGTSALLISYLFSTFATTNFSGAVDEYNTKIEDLK